VVVRNGFSQDLATMFLADLRSTVERLGRGRGSISDEERTSFHH
jgi:hypothetical protein